MNRRYTSDKKQEAPCVLGAPFLFRGSDGCIIIEFDGEFDREFDAPRSG
jgi:hypothetical protein